ncbi:MAG: hypothetical protein ABSE72_01795 [Bacteroidales bacterium]|jgi:hypothetical protein
MKAKFIFLFATSLLFIACNKENKNNPEKNINVGGVYLPYTDLVRSPTNSTINISDSICQFNRIEAIYYSYKPTTNQNVFIMTFIDTLSSKGKAVELDIFTKHMNPGDFFQKSSLTIDSIMIGNTNIMIGNASVRDNFFNANAILTWDTAYFENFSFKGKGHFEIIDTLHSTIEPPKFYPNQKINFEFK